SDETELQITIKSRCAGWVAIGLNSRDAIVGSELFMMTKNREPEHHFVTGLGLHPKVESLGRKNAIRTFRYDRQKLEYKLTLSNRIPLQKYNYLIVACSMEDDFQHHSIERRHFQIKR